MAEYSSIAEELEGLYDELKNVKKRECEIRIKIGELVGTSSYSGVEMLRLPEGAISFLINHGFNTIYDVYFKYPELLNVIYKEDDKKLERIQMLKDIKDQMSLFFPLF